LEKSRVLTSEQRTYNIKRLVDEVPNGDTNAPRYEHAGTSNSNSAGIEHLLLDDMLKM
jgi:hypothetical protein